MLLRLCLSICLIKLDLNYCDIINDDDRGIAKNPTDVDENTTVLESENSTTDYESSVEIGLRSFHPSEFDDEGELIGKINDAVDRENWTTSDHLDDALLRSIRPSSSSSCITPDERKGLCVPIKECKYLNDLLIYRIREPSVPSMLRRSQCGDRNSNTHFVCCANNTTSRTESNSESSVFFRPSKKSNFPSLTRKSSKRFQCGKRSLTSIRVVGGRESELGAWPWMTALYCTGNRKSVFRCAGSLISDEWVLTASHCSLCSSSSLALTQVRLGDLDLNQSVDDQATPVTIPIKQFIRHPKYRTSPIQNDIALIRLSRPVKFSSLIYPVCLLSGEQFLADEFYTESELPYITGWGSTEYGSPMSTHLMEANVPIVSAIQCQKSYREYKSQASIDKRVICAGNGTRDACSGDSGGPLMFINPNTDMVYQGGVVSFGVRCAEEDFPGVYTKVAAFIDWINNSTGLTF